MDIIAWGSGMSSEVLAQRLNMTVDEINEIIGKSGNLENDYDEPEL